MLRLRAYTGELRPRETLRRLRHYAELPIRKEHDAQLVTRGLEIAIELGRPRAYDAMYLALAERHHAPLWTADERLWNAARTWTPWLRRLGE